MGLIFRHFLGLCIDDHRIRDSEETDLHATDLASGEVSWRSAPVDGPRTRTEELLTHGAVAAERVCLSGGTDCHAKLACFEAGDGADVGLGAHPSRVDCCKSYGQVSIHCHPGRPDSDPYRITG